MSAVTAWVLAGALWLGCLHPARWWLALVGGAMLAAAARAGRGCVYRRQHGLLALTAASLALVGSGLAGGREALAGGGLLPQLADRGGIVAIEGTLVSEPRVSAHGAWAVIRVRQVGGQRTRERALLRADEQEGLPAFGERLAFRGSARPLEPGGFGAYARRLYAWVELNPANEITVTGPAPAFVRRTNVVRERTRLAAARHLDPDDAALLSGLVTGDTRGLPEAREDQLDAAGLSHLIAVSGSNVALVLAGALGLAQLAGVGIRARRWIGVAALCWFALLVRAEPSVLRASVMAVLVLLAGMLGRRLEPLHTLAIAAVILLLVDPAIAGQLGFGLSVLATAGVLVVAPWLAGRLPGPRPVRLLLAATVGAQLGVAPLLIRVEGTVPLGALPANLIAGPAASAASIIGAVAALVAQAWVPAGGALAALAGPPLEVIFWAAQRFAEGPGLGPRDLVLPMTVALALAVVTRGRAPRLAVAAVVGVVALGTLPDLQSYRGTMELTLTALDVGQGDALLIEAPPGVRMLVDGGPEPGLALRHLRQRGIRRLDAVALTHPHADHSGGLPAVLAAMPVGVLLVGPAPLDRLADVAPSALATYQTASARRVPFAVVTAGQHFALGSARVEVLSPPRDSSVGDEPNDNSLVLRISDANGSILLTGDAEIAAQTRLLQRPERLRAAILKIPHHGGDTNAEGFFEAVGARVAVISVGSGNDYGHPTRPVLAALRSRDVRRTDLDGTVSVALTAGGPRVAGGHRAPGTPAGATGDGTREAAARLPPTERTRLRRPRRVTLRIPSTGQGLPTRRSAQVRRVSPLTRERRRPRRTVPQRHPPGLWRLHPVSV
ncbi:MAG: ComEC/Rec2 family competence protein [Egibacteraceae bacterium]